MATSKPQRSILTLMSRVLGAQFAGESWAAWRALLQAIFALPLSASDLATFRALTGRQEAPVQPSREAWLVCGRRAGKSNIAALVAVYLTTCRSYALAVGERGVFMVVAADRRQARVVRRYIGGLLHATPVLEHLIATETRDAIELTSGITIEIHTASFRTIRGYTVVVAVLDELAFWPTDDAADPDREILAALRPAMATIPDALLLCLSSAYARRGELWKAHREHFGRDGDPVLVIQAGTRALNPTVPQDVIDRAYEEDPASAAAEYDAQFRTDVEGFVSLDAIQAVTVSGRLELPPADGFALDTSSPVAFVDVPGGSGTDSMTLGIARREKREGRSVAVLVCLREVKPPFSPEAIVAEFAAVLKTYGIATVTGDKYAGEWPREQFQKHGIKYLVSERTKSDIYQTVLPMMNSGGCELLDHPRLQSQLAGLERRVARSGKDSIDHVPGGHDDVVNAACGALVLASAGGSGKYTALTPDLNRPLEDWCPLYY